MVKLEARDGSWGIKDLYLGEDILLVQYGGGDCDTIQWPFGVNCRANLAAALFDAYEMGDIKERQVLLPDGEVFDIDANLETRGLRSSTEC
jgi:hypothetical protein